jgi:hypothetical protein
VSARWTDLTEEQADALLPVGYVHVTTYVEYGLGSVLPPGLYPVHHLAPRGFTLYEKNDLGHRMSVEYRHVAGGRLRIKCVA